MQPSTTRGRLRWRRPAGLPLGGGASLRMHLVAASTTPRDNGKKHGRLVSKPPKTGVFLLDL